MSEEKGLVASLNDEKYQSTDTGKDEAKVWF